MIKRHKILSIGDCNTEGINNLKYNSYPERIGNILDLKVINCGYTMTTTREGLLLFDQYYNKDKDKDIDIVSIQFGLVDSWKTLNYSPYVLYYPNNFFRKIARKVVKKTKKIAKTIKLNDLLGLKSVVNIDEYQHNIKKIIESIDKHKKVLLIETIPNKDLLRNAEILKYNNILKKLSENYDNCIYIDIYEDFMGNFDKWYYDNTHINSIGYDFISKKIIKLLNESYK